MAFPGVRIGSTVTPGSARFAPFSEVFASRLPALRPHEHERNGHPSGAIGEIGRRDRLVRRQPIDKRVNQRSRASTQRQSRARDRALGTLISGVPSGYVRTGQAIRDERRYSMDFRPDREPEHSGDSRSADGHPGGYAPLPVDGTRAELAARSEYALGHPVQSSATRGQIPSGGRWERAADRQHS